MHQEISASTIFKVVEILIIASLLVLLPGGQVMSGREPSLAEHESYAIEATYSAELEVSNSQ